MKKITSLFLAIFLVLGIIPLSVHAEEKTVITEINAYFDFTLPSYGEQIDRTPFDITIEGDIPVTISTVNFDWYINRNGENISIRNGYFTDGMWCFDLKVELNDTDNYTFDGENGTTLKINDSVWSTDIKSDGWVYSPYYEIQYVPGELPLTLYSPLNSKVPISYIGNAITPIDFSIGALGGTKPYIFSKSGGADWLQISEDGILSGTPLEAGENEQIRVTVTDALGAEAYLDVSIDKTYINPEDRAVISRVEATIDLPEFYCGYTIANSYPATVTEGAPAVITTNNSDFYHVDNEGNKGNSTKQLVAGKFTMDFKVEFSGENVYNYTLDKENLEVIINGQHAAYEHVIINQTGSFVWVTIPPFEVDHIFDNDTDATCNGCDFTREGCDHQYENACDTSCNVCSATRVIEHQYEAACDDECNECKEKRVAEPHTFDDCNDGYCNVCSFYRSVPSHNYDDCNDGVCNDCEGTRNTPSHTYTNYWDTTCDFCGEPRIINTIALNEKKTAIIEVGGSIIEYVFTPSITGEFVFEAFASSDTYGYVFDENGEQLWNNDDGGFENQFKIQETFVAGKTYILKVKFYSEDVTGEIPFSIVCVHDFTDNCDPDCGICEIVRDAPHSYDNAVDTQCNECSNVRELNLIGINEIKTVEITRDNEYVDFVFTPEVSGEYFFIGLGDESQDTFAYILDSEENMLSSNDDSGENHQFKITYDMEAGKTYILRACFCDNGDIGIFPVSLNCAHNYDDKCDPECNICSSVREAPHDFVNGCDSECDNCGHTRTPDPHKYTNCEDSGCNVCGKGREAGKCVWESCFDSTCDACGFERKVPKHTYTNHLDTECDECETSRELNYIKLGETKNFTLQEEETVFFVFVCQTSGKYAFSSHFAEFKDAVGYIYSVDNDQLAYDDDGGVESRQFYLEYDFTAGTTYILEAKLYSNDESGDGAVSFLCVEHSFDDEFDSDCNACGFIREAKQDVNVIAKGDIDFTVLGNVITVDNQLACKVGYIVEDEYLNVVGTKNTDGTYSFIAPEGVSDVIIVVKGDVTADATIDSTDYLRIKGHFLDTYTFDGANLFAADVTGDGVIDSTDYMRIKGHFLETYDLHN